MRIDSDEKIKVEPLKERVIPEIIFHVPLYYGAPYEMPIGSTGILLSEDHFLP